MRKWRLLILLIVFSLAGCSLINQIQVDDKTAKEALQYALQKEGSPYVWGGRGPDEFDCSGLITWAYKEGVGREYIFRVGNKKTDDATMHQLYRFNVQEIPLQKMIPGDIVFITKEEGEITHGGMFIKWIKEYEEFKFINASSYFEKVAIDTWPVEGRKRGQWFVGAGRLKIVY